MYPWDGKNIYLSGFMATGKSRVGKALAELIGWPFLDTDEVVEKTADKTISEIFAQSGEQGFRRLEKKVVAEICSQQQVVVALGGGAVLDGHNRDLLSASGIVICLHADIDILFDRISLKKNRPLMFAQDQQELLTKIKTLLAARQPYYDQADYHFTSSPEITAEQLAEHIFNTLRDEI